MMAMPADGVRVRLMSDVRTCSTRERLTPRDKEQSQRRQSVHLGARNPAGGAAGHEPYRTDDDRQPRVAHCGRRRRRGGPWAACSPWRAARKADKRD